MPDLNPLDKPALQTPDAKLMFWLVRPLHLLAVRWFYKQFTKIP